MSGFVDGQAWSGIVNPARAVDWSKAGISGGIPNRTTVCATLSAGATASQINSAIAGCPSGQVVYLNAGTYNLSSGIDFNGKSDVTLRGAGADQTKIIFGSGAAVSCHGLAGNVCIGSADTNWPGGPSNTASWTGSGPWPKGTTQITLSNVSNLAVGKPLILDQLDDVSDSGGIYVCETVAGNCNDDGSSGGPSGGQRNGRGQEQIVTVTAISGNTVTFSPGLYMPNWRASESPGAWWATSPAYSDSVENLSLDHTASDEQAGMTIFNCLGCWVKGIRSINSNRSHVWIYSSAHTVVRDSYFYGTKNSVSQSYGTESFGGSSDVLVENNIFQHITAPQMINSAASGTVVAYNYSVDDYYNNGGSYNYGMQSIWLHAGGIDNMLFEGNVGFGLRSDLFHGTHHFITAFRNRWNGFDVGKTSNTVPVFLDPYSRFYNLIGNVLGDNSSPQNTYQNTPSSGSGNPIYILGAGTVYVALSGDQQTPNTLMRWGNYDTINKAVRWVSSEVPSNSSSYPNAVPAGQSLPASFYLSKKPNWWGSVAWPPIGPDVSNGNLANIGGHANAIPAQICYSNSLKDSKGVLTFNASQCYGTTGAAPAPPMAPSKLSATSR